MGNEKIIENQEKILNQLEQIIKQQQAPRVYDLYDLEKILKVSRRTLFSYKAKGLLPYSQIGHKIFVTEKQLLQFLSNHEEKSIKEEFN